MVSQSDIASSFKAALPIMMGYIAIGVPCGVLSASIGLNAFQVFLMCALFYSGAGQFMVPNMWLSGAPLASIVASVSFVNSRQILYSTAFAPRGEGASKLLSFFFAATVTDESFGVNLTQFERGDWNVARATLVNLFSQSSWTASCVVGTFIGNALNIPLPIAAFAMTSIFICLLVIQKLTLTNIVAALGAALGVFIFKLIGLSGPAIFFGALFGVACALIVSRLRGRA